MTFKASALAAAWILLSPPAARGGVGGREAFSFLKQSPFAASAGMAEADAAVVGEVTALYANPAGLAHLRSHRWSLQSVRRWQDVSQAGVAYVRPMKRGGWGVEGGLLSMGDLPRTRFDPGSADRFVEAGRVRAGSQHAAAAFGRRMSSDVAVGAGLRVAREELDGESAVAVMADAGVVRRLPGFWRVAVTVQHLGPPVQFLSKSVSPPARIRVGLYTSPQKWAEWETDVVYNLQGDSEVLIGGQFNWEGKAFFRAGYRYRSRSLDLGSFSGLAAGVGGRWGAFQADYAFQPFGVLGDTHRVSLAWRFHEPPRSAEPRRKPMIGREVSFP